jgi:hypothetical protein
MDDVRLARPASVRRQTVLAKRPRETRSFAAKNNAYTLKAAPPAKKQKKNE